MKKILVPIDFSTHTETICRYAIEIAKKTGGELRLFHAYFDFIIATDTTFLSTIETNEIFNHEMLVQIREQAKTDMQKLHTEMLDEIKKERVKNVKIVFTLTGGLPNEEILNISETYQPDLIIMGTHGKGEKDILSGKVSSKVIHNATCRILTIPPNAKYNGFKSILYATNFNDNDNRDMEKLIDLLAGYNPSIHCVHIATEKKSGNENEKMIALKTYYDSKFNNTDINFDVIYDEDFLKGMNKYIKEKSIDLVAIVHHRKSFLHRLFIKDHTHQLLFHSDVPLYIFPGIAK